MKLQAENEALQSKVAVTEQEKAEILDSNEKLEEENTRLKGTKERYKLELQEKSERIQSLERMAQQREAQVHSLTLGAHVLKRVTLLVLCVCLCVPSCGS